MFMAWTMQRGNFATRRRAPNLNRIPCVTEDECLSMRLTMKSVISRISFA